MTIDMPVMSHYAVFDQFGIMHGRVRCLDEGEAVTTVIDHGEGDQRGLEFYAVELPFVKELALGDSKPIKDKDSSRSSFIMQGCRVRYRPPIWDTGVGIVFMANSVVLFHGLLTISDKLTSRSIEGCNFTLDENLQPGQVVIEAPQKNDDV